MKNKGTKLYNNIKDKSDPYRQLSAEKLFNFSRENMIFARLGCDELKEYSQNLCDCF